VQAKAAIGLDVGGTRVKAVVVEDEGTVLDQVVRHSVDDGVERWAEVAPALVQELIQQLRRGTLGWRLRSGTRRW